MCFFKIAVAGATSEDTTLLPMIMRYTDETTAAFFSCFPHKKISQMGKLIRLTIPKQLKDYLDKLSHNANFIYLKTKTFSNIAIRQFQLNLSGKGKTLLTAVY